MVFFLILFTSSMLLCLGLTPLVRLLALHSGLVDRPDGIRKIHSRPTPVAGGLAVLLAMILTLSGAVIVQHPDQDIIVGQLSELGWLLAAALVICSVGVLDDYGCLRGRHKLLGQVAACAMLVGSGLLVRRISFFDLSVDLGILAGPVTILILLGAINSLNLLDGIDGLLSTVGLIVTLGMGMMALLGEHWPTAALAFAMAGALLGFLGYNFPPASIFLGDTGSMLIGLVVGVLAIRGSLKGPATVALVAPLATLTIPILDTTAAILRRKLTGRSIYTTDRGHIHHCLLNRGLSNRGALCCISIICLLTVTGALASLTVKNELVALLTTLVVIGVLIGVRLFGYAECVLAKKRLLAALISFMRPAQGSRPHAMEVRLQGSADWKAVWSRLTACASQLNLKTVYLDVNAPVIHESYHARWDCAHYESEGSSLWSATMPLQITNGQMVGRLVITGYRDAEPLWKKIAILTQMLQEVEASMGLLLDSLKASGAEERADSRPHALFKLRNGRDAHSSFESESTAELQARSEPSTKPKAAVAM
jgi:UDP-GlcNAc:undecaprenyl-phosphate GlcNAc-1-phosphate transferase